jgi:hypothetical protein
VETVPEFLADDGGVFAGIGRALMDSFPDVDPVVDDFVDKALIDPAAALVGDAFSL